MKNVSFRKKILSALLSAIGIAGFAQDNRIRIAAASDVKFALDSAMTIFEKESGIDVVITYGSTGKLYEQIFRGAPFDIFFSADLSYPEKLRAAGIAISEPRLYAVGRLVIWSAVVDPSALKTQTLTHQNVRKIAIANPQHAPYGKGAVEALRFYNLYEEVRERLVLGENISQASQYLYSGAADAGIIALSMAMSPPMRRIGGSYYLLPQESHQTLRQAFVLLSAGKGNQGLKRLNAFLATETSRAIFRSYGFTIPDEAIE